MFSKSTLVAAMLAGAAAVTANDHAGSHGHPGPHQCKTTSTVVVYATETETATVYAGGAGAGAQSTWGGGAAGYSAAPATVTVTEVLSVTVGATGTGGSGGFGGGNGGHSSSSAAAAATTSTSSTGGSGGFSGGNGGHGSGSVTTTGISSISTPSTPAAPTALCLTNASASYLTNGYGQLLSAYTNATANAILASDFTDTSDSINWLAGIPLGGYTFSSKAAFIAGQGTQPPIGFSVTSMFFSCTQVAFRWTAMVGLKKFPVKGINMFTASNLNGSASGWQIETMFSEFDVGAWEVDIGRTCSPQGANIAGS